MSLTHSVSQEDLAILYKLDRTYISSIYRTHRNISLKNIAAWQVNVQSWGQSNHRTCCSLL